MLDFSVFAADIYTLFGVILAEIITFFLLEAQTDLCQTVYLTTLPLKSVFLTLVTFIHLQQQFCENGVEC